MVQQNKLEQDELLECDHGLPDIQHYDIWTANKKTRLYRNEILRYQSLLKLLPNNKSIALDAGCGAGYMSYLMASQLGYKVTAVDLALSRIKAFVDQASKFNIIQLNENLFNLTGQEYDVIVSQEVIEHVSDYQALLRKMYTYLRSGGCAVFAVPYNEDLKVKQIQCSICGAEYHKNGHLHSFNEEKLTTAVLDAGFVEPEVKLIVNNRVVKWYAKLNIEITANTLGFDSFMNRVAPHKAAHLAIKCFKA